MKLVINMIVSIVILFIAIGIPTMLDKLFLDLSENMLFLFNVIFGGLILGFLSTIGDKPHE